jgi:hypothetical protein
LSASGGSASSTNAWRDWTKTHRAGAEPAFRSGVVAEVNRLAPVLPRPHQSAKIEHEYVRRGAWAYLAAWDVRRSKLFGRCEPRTGFATFDRCVAQVMAQEPCRSALAALEGALLPFQGVCRKDPVRCREYRQGCGCDRRPDEIWGVRRGQAAALMSVECGHPLASAIRGGVSLVGGLKMRNAAATISV